MDFTIDLDDSRLRIQMGGRLTFADAPRFRELVDALDRPRVSGCVIDLSRLEFVDSTGITLFILANDHAQAREMPLELRNPRGAVKAMLDRLDIDKLIPIT